MKEVKKQFVIIRQNNLLISSVFEDQVLDNVIVDETGENSLKAGDIYICKVSHIVKNINAAFVEIQKNKMCYLPLDEISEPDGKVIQGQEFPVQIKKAAVKKKQAVVTRKLEFSGKYAVVTTLNQSKSISTKINSEPVRVRLKNILNGFQDISFGIILRTSCEEAEDEVIITECRSLVEEAKKVVERAESRTCFTKLYGSPMEFMKFLRDMGKGAFDRILTDDPDVFDRMNATGYLSGENIQYYEDKTYPLDKLFGVCSKLEKALVKHVWLKSGGSLVIEPTEALTVIDVNTEKAIAGKRNSETTFFKINLEAAREAARQIRIRNLSGIILIDFIDMREKEHEKALLDELKDEFQKDKVKTTVVDITKLGLVEITRMKVRKPLADFLRTE